MMKDRLKALRVHFIGIGGVGMNALAEVFFRLGAQVSGSDLVWSDRLERFQKMGLKVIQGHFKENLKNVDLVIFSSAISSLNEEYQEALFQGVPLISRSEALAEIMRFKRNIVVTGSHGKTTTTALLVSLFSKAKKNPSFVVGGKLNSSASFSALGNGDWFIAEADESDGNLHYFSPEHLVITNIDQEHLDYHTSLSDLEESLYRLALTLPFYGTLIVCGDYKNTNVLFNKSMSIGNSKESSKISKKEGLKIPFKHSSQEDSFCFIESKEKLFYLDQNLRKKTFFYGFEEDNEYVLRREEKTKCVYHLYFCQASHRRLICSFSPALPGDQNALNATASLLVGLQSGLSLQECLKGVEEFEGVERRLDHKGKRGSIDFYDDYGHHPTEIKALLKTFKEQFPERRLVVLFQPHRFSRTHLCWNEFLSCFEDANRLYVLDIYSAGEEPIKGVSSEILCDKLKRATYIKEEKILLLKKELQPGDVFLTLGAGDVWKWGEKIYSNKV